MAPWNEYTDNPYRQGYRGHQGHHGHGGPWEADERPDRGGGRGRRGRSRFDWGFGENAGQLHFELRRLIGAVRLARMEDSATLTAVSECLSETTQSVLVLLANAGRSPDAVVPPTGGDDPTRRSDPAA